MVDWVRAPFTATSHRSPRTSMIRRDMCASDQVAWAGNGDSCHSASADTSRGASSRSRDSRAASRPAAIATARWSASAPLSLNSRNRSGSAPLRNTHKCRPRARADGVELGQHRRGTPPAAPRRRGTRATVRARATAIPRLPANVSMDFFTSAMKRSASAPSTTRWSKRERQHALGADGERVACRPRSSRPAASRWRRRARIATCGWLMIGMPIDEPKPPGFVIVKVPLLHLVGAQLLGPRALAEVVDGARQRRAARARRRA